MKTDCLNFTARSRGVRPARVGMFVAGRRRGFTLIEVLVTLLLLGITLPVVMQGIALSSNAGSTAQRRSEAAALAESKLNELIVTGNWQSASLSGDFMPDWPDYSWTGQLSSWGQGQGADGTNIVQQLDIQVTWTGIGTQQPVKVSTLVYQSASATASVG